MKTYYKGYELDAHREECLGGWDTLYFSVYRLSDQLEVICDFEDSEESIVSMLHSLEVRVDEFIKSKGDSEDLAEDY